MGVGAWLLGGLVTDGARESPDFGGAFQLSPPQFLLTKGPFNGSTKKKKKTGYNDEPRGAFFVLF